jgi:hypothetical protein
LLTIGRWPAAILAIALASRRIERRRVGAGGGRDDADAYTGKARRGIVALTRAPMATCNLIAWRIT